jgi:hypothetical protein
MRAGRPRTEDLPLSIASSRRWRSPPQAALAGGRVATLRLPAPADPAAARRRRLFRRYREERLGGQKARRPQARARDPDAADDPVSAEPTLEPRLRRGRTERRPAPAGPGCGRRLQPECLALVADRSLTGRRLTRELDRIAELRRLSLMIVSDNVLGRKLAGLATTGLRSPVCAGCLGEVNRARWLPRPRKELSAIANTGSSGGRPWPSPS